MSVSAPTAIRKPTIIHALRDQADRLPERRVFTFLNDGEADESSLSYGELDAQARAIGAVLQGYRAGGKAVLLLYPPGIPFIAAFFGCLYGGAIAVPLPSPEPERPQRIWPRLLSVARDAQASLALTCSSTLESIRQFVSAPHELRSIHWLATDSISRDLADEWWVPDVSGESLAYLQYTSGSTAAPKGVMMAHDNLLHNSQYIADAWGYEPESTSVMWVPHFHDDGLVHGIVQPVYRGFRAVLMSPLSFVQQPIRWLRAISRYRATHSGGPNFAYMLCVRKISLEQSAQLDLRTWRVAYNAAEPIRKETLEQFARAFEPCGFRRSSFYPAYGLAEATLLVTTRRKAAEPVFCTVEADPLQQRNLVVEAGADTTRARTFAGCGQAVGETKVIIVDPQTGTRCPPNEVGEIWISDRSVVRGYWNRPDETERTFRAYLSDTHEGPFLRTADLGFLKEGELYVTGRIKDLIIIRGQNHYPEDIEWTVQDSHSSLRPGCCAAFSADLKGEERLIVAAEVRPTSTSQPANLHSVVEAIRQAVSEQHGLHIYSVLLLQPGSIPKTSSGKIQRHVCRAGFLAGTLKTVEGGSHDVQCRVG